MPSLIAFVGAVHQQGQCCGHRSQIPEQFTAFGGIVRVARRESKGYGRSSIRGNQMNLGCPSAARLANGLWSVFLTPRCRPDALSPRSSPERKPRSGCAQSAPVAASQISGRERHSWTSGSCACRWYASYRTVSAAHATCTRDRPHTAAHSEIAGSTDLHYPLHRQAVLDSCVLLFCDFHLLPLYRS